MSKRQADTYLTKEPPRNRPAGDDFENERDKIDPVQLASEEVMATRKYPLQMCVRVLMVCRLAKPRRNRFANAGAANENVFPF
jgi:hypothetical protein